MSHLQTNAGSMENDPFTTKQLVVKERDCRYCTASMLDIVFVITGPIYSLLSFDRNSINDYIQLTIALCIKVMGN